MFHLLILLLGLEELLKFTAVLFYLVSYISIRSSIISWLELEYLLDVKCSQSCVVGIWSILRCNHILVIGLDIRVVLIIQVL